MSRAILEITLKGPAVFTRTSATLGAAETLRHIPGSNLLGAAAARLYREAGAEAFRLFHSGQVRFGDGLPTHNGAVGWPTPSSLHREKSSGKLDPMQNLAIVPHPGKPLSQVRDGFLTTTGIAIAPEVSSTLRTAISEDGRARDGFLYGLESLQAGQTFRAVIEADREDDLRRVVAALVGPQRLGRSRSAEFGQVDIREVQGEASPPSGRADPGRLVLWCLSDVALLDSLTQAPTFVVTAETLGLPTGWQLDAARTFLRTRTYSPYNGTRQRPDLERQVLQAGSVLVFSGGPPLDVEALSARLGRGVGAWLHDGLGRIAVNPTMLLAETVQTTKPDATRPQAPAPQDGMFAWLTQRNEEAKRLDEAVLAANAIRSAMAGNKLSASQWGQVRNIARLHRGREAELRAALEAFCRDGTQLGKDGRTMESTFLKKRWGQMHKGAKAFVVLRDAIPSENGPEALELAAGLLAQDARRRNESEEPTSGAQS